MQSSLMVPVGSKYIIAHCQMPLSYKATVLLIHGSGSNTDSPRMKYIADVLNNTGIACLLIDLLTGDEAKVDKETSEYRFKMDLLSERVTATVDWFSKNTAFGDVPIGIYGASTGAAAAFIAASVRQDIIKAIVSRGGRPDMAGHALSKIGCPTLLLVGGNDSETIRLNQKALSQMKHASDKRLVIVPNAGHMFEEKGTLEEVAKHTASWFEMFLFTDSFAGTGKSNK